jgi:dipeptidyl aminopeptidase/acylaminoacyl peptidase
VPTAPAAASETPPAPPKAKGPLIFNDQDGAPPIPEALSARLLRYLEARSASLASISDDGRSLLVLTRLGQAAQVHRVDLPLGARTQVTFESEPVRLAAFVPRGKGAFVFARDTGGNEQYQLFRQEPGALPLRLTDGRSRNEGFLFARDGARLAWRSNARNGKDMDLWWSDGRIAESASLLLEVSGQWSPMAFSPDGRRLIAQEWISVSEQRLHLVDVDAKTSRPLTTEKAAFREVLFDASGERLFVLTDRSGDFVELQVLTLPVDGDVSKIKASDWARPTATIAWNVERMALSPDGRSLAFTVNEDGYGALRMLDTQTLKELPQPALPRGIVGDIAYAAEAPVLAFSFGGPTVNGDVYTYSPKSKAVTRWTRSEVGGLDESQFVAPELVRYRTFDGREIPAFLYRPRGSGPSPVVINIHGGPEAQSRPNFSALTQYLVTQSGIAVLVPNVRGSDGYGKAYLALDNGRLREDSVKDIGALIDWVGTRPELDASRVAVMGGSYGGYMVLASLVHFGDRLKAGIDVVGISNFVTFLENTASYRRDLRRVEYGDESDPVMREFLQAISPTTQAAKIRSALFVVHGANDPRVPLSEAEQIVDIVRSSGQEVWKLVAMNEGHGFAKRENRDAFTALSVLFLERHLAK